MNRVIDFVETVKQFISKNKLLDTDKKYLIALSGGADSTALLLIMHQLGYDIEATHCNFNLRGAESVRDENFCKSLCSRYQIPIHLVHFDTRSYADLHKESIELAARHLRYSYFEQLKRDIHAQAILVAHHQDDNVETILMNLLRGTGLHGLTGIHPVRDDIVRPLLCVNRNEIEAYLKECRQDYVTDSTNLIDDVTRNKIRLNLIPELIKINSKAVENILSTANHLSHAEEFITKAGNGSTEKDIDGSEIIRTKGITEYELYLHINKFGFNYKVIEEIFQNINGSAGRIYISNDYELLIDRDYIKIKMKSGPFKPIKLPEDGTYVINNLNGCKNERKIKLHWEKIDDGFIIPKGKQIIALDGDTIQFPLTIRNVKDGDRFNPFGMSGTKLVNDYLTDCKFDLFRKRSQLVIVDATGKIIWLFCERPSDFCKITNNSQRALVIEVIES